MCLNQQKLSASSLAIYHRPIVSNILFRCGATIINKRTLVSTATCLVTSGRIIQAKNLLVAVRETQLFSQSANRLNVIEVKLHESFKPLDTDKTSLKFDYNVGILILAKEIEFSLHVSPICLPSNNKFDFRGKTGFVVGWGMNDRHQLSEKLHQLEVATYPFIQCFYKNREFFGGYSSNRNFCAGYADRGICSGKDGLIINNQS